MMKIFNIIQYFSWEKCTASRKKAISHCWWTRWEKMDKGQRKRNDEVHGKVQFIRAVEKQWGNPQYQARFHSIWTCYERTIQFCLNARICLEYTPFSLGCDHYLQKILGAHQVSFIVSETRICGENQQCVRVRAMSRLFFCAPTGWVRHFVGEILS